MAGVFALIRGPQRQLVGHHGMVQRADPRALELQAAKEIRQCAEFAVNS